MAGRAGGMAKAVDAGATLGPGGATCGDGGAIGVAGGGARGAAVILLGLFEPGGSGGVRAKGGLGRGAGAYGVGAGTIGCTAMDCVGGGSGVATMLAEYPPEDAACGGNTSTVPEKIV